MQTVLIAYHEARTYSQHMTQVPLLKCAYDKCPQTRQQPTVEHTATVQRKRRENTILCSLFECECHRDTHRAANKIVLYVEFVVDKVVVVVVIIVAEPAHTFAWHIKYKINEPVLRFMFSSSTQAFRDNELDVYWIALSLWTEHGVLQAQLVIIY